MPYIGTYLSLSSLSYYGPSCSEDSGGDVPHDQLELSSRHGGKVSPFVYLLWRQSAACQHAVMISSSEVCLGIGVILQGGRHTQYMLNKH